MAVLLVFYNDGRNKARKGSSDTKSGPQSIKDRRQAGRESASE